MVPHLPNTFKCKTCGSEFFFPRKVLKLLNIDKSKLQKPLPFTKDRISGVKETSSIKPS